MDTKFTKRQRNERIDKTNDAPLSFQRAPLPQNLDLINVLTKKRTQFLPVDSIPKNEDFAVVANHYNATTCIKGAGRIRTDT